MKFMTIRLLRKLLRDYALDSPLNGLTQKDGRLVL